MKLHCSNCSFSIPTLILLQRTMDPDLQAKLLSCYNASLEWTQSFKIRQNNADIDLSWACGPNSSPIPSAVDQPKHFPDRSYFRFPKCYHGEASLESLTEMIKGALPGANFIKVCGPASQYKRYSLHCLHSVRNTSKSQTYNHDTYRQIGVKNETIKRTKTLGIR